MSNKIYSLYIDDLIDNKSLKELKGIASELPTKNCNKHLIVLFLERLHFEFNE